MTKTNVYHISYYSSLRSAYMCFDGCNFSCKECFRKVYLYDPLLGKNYPKNIMKKYLTIEEIIKLLMIVKPREVIFGGGEPTLDKNLGQISMVVKNEICSYNLLLTNGYLFSYSLEGFDEIRLCIKAYNEIIHQEYTGRSNKNVLGNFKKIWEMKAPEFKLAVDILLIPGYIDFEEIERIAQFVSNVDQFIEFKIIAYYAAVPKDKAPWRSASVKDVMKAVDVAKRYLRNVIYLLREDKEKMGEVLNLWPL